MNPKQEKQKQKQNLKSGEKKAKEKIYTKGEVSRWLQHL